MCATKIMNFQDVSPDTFTNGHHGGIFSAATTATAVKPCRNTKAASLPPSRPSQADLLLEIAQELTFARPHGQEPPADRLSSGEFPFQIRGNTEPTGQLSDQGRARQDPLSLWEG